MEMPAKRLHAGRKWLYVQGLILNAHRYDYVTIVYRYSNRMLVSYNLHVTGSKLPIEKILIPMVDWNTTTRKNDGGS